MQSLYIVIILFFFSNQALADQTRHAPEDIVTAPRIEPFSDRSGGWPNQPIPQQGKREKSNNWWTGWDDTEGVSGRYEGAPAISVRGSVKADRSLVLWDGIPLNLSDGIGPTELLIPEEIIGQIHVFKGPASVFYGRSALGGALLNQSKMETSAKLRISTASESTSAMEALVPFGTSSSQNQFSLFGLKTKGDHSYSLRSNSLSGRRDHNASELQRYTLVGKSTTGPWTLQHRLLFARKTGEYPNRIDQTPTILTPGNGEFDRQVALAGISLSRPWGSQHRFSWSIAGIRSDQDSDPNTYIYSHSRTDRLYQAFNYIHESSANWVSKIFLDHFQDHFTANYLDDQPLHSGEIEAGFSIEIPTSNTTFVQPAVRYLDEHKKAILAFGFFQKDSLFEKWMTFSQGFRSPTLADRFCNNAFCLGNPDLSPEHSDQIEIGFNSRPVIKIYKDTAFSWLYGLSLFSADHKDYFEFETIGAQYRTINGGSAKIVGGEAHLTTQFGPWTTRLGLSHLDGENVAQKSPLLLIPEWTGKLKISWSARDWSSWSRIKYMGSYLDRLTASDPTIDLGKVWLVDWGVSRRTTNWLLETTVLNLFNQPVERRIGYPDPQLNLKLSLTYWL